MILDYSEFITQKSSRGLVNYETVSINGEAFFKHDHLCPFCHVPAEKTYEKQKKEYPEWLAGSFDQYESVFQCPRCGWWEYEYRNQSDAIIDGIRASDIEYSSAILRKYNDNAVDVPVAALREYIQKKPEVIYGIDAHKMEELVRSVFSDFYPSCTVKSFGKTRDGGKDGLLIDENGQQFLIQIKRRTKADATEGVIPLREFIGATVLEDGINGCIFVSTADHFSNPAKQYAQDITRKRIVESFDLIDCREFIKMIEVAQESIPDYWNQLLQL